MFISVKRFIPIILILTLAFVLRVINLDISPPGFNADEAALGYNAYSILKTGKDEWGEFLPIVFKSFSDYKPGIYVYLDIPFVLLLGLNEFSVRLPSILFGMVSVYLIYLLSKRIFKNELAALSSAFLLAISPWHLHYSRGAWETNVATTFMILGVLFFTDGLNNCKKFYLSGLAFVLAMYSYQSTRVVVPVLVIFLVFFYLRGLNIRKVLGPLILSLVLLIPLISIIFSSQGLARFQGVSIFTDIGPQVRANQDRGEHSNLNDLLSRIYHNRWIGYGTNFFEHYTDHFNANFLFIWGDPLGRNRTPESGQMYFFEILTLGVGVFTLLNRKFKNVKIIIIWLLVAPLAASLTYQTPHALRAHNMVIPLIIISGLGLGVLIEQVLRLKFIYKYSLLVFGTLGTVYFVSVFMHEYYVHLPKTYALEWEYGFSKVVPYIFANKDSYDKVIITTRYDQPYILFLFYSKYEPIKYRVSAKSTTVDRFGFSTISGFDNFIFKEITPTDFKQKNTLIVGTAEETRDYKEATKTINFPNGTPVFRIIDVNRN